MAMWLAPLTKRDCSSKTLLLPFICSWYDVCDYCTHLLSLVISSWAFCCSSSCILSPSSLFSLSSDSTLTFRAAFSTWNSPSLSSLLCRLVSSSSKRTLVSDRRAFCCLSSWCGMEWVDWMRYMYNRPCAFSKQLQSNLESFIQFKDIDRRNHCQNFFE